MTENKDEIQSELQTDALKRRFGIRGGVLAACLGMSMLAPVPALSQSAPRLSVQPIYGIPSTPKAKGPELAVRVDANVVSISELDSGEFQLKMEVPGPDKDGVRPQEGSQVFIAELDLKAPVHFVYEDFCYANVSVEEEELEGINVVQVSIFPPLEY